MEEKKKDLQKEKLAEEFVKTLGNLEKMDEVEKMIKDNISAADQDKMVENYLEKVVGAQ